MADAIRFILNGRLREVEGLSPTTTLLQYLRGPAGLPGTKEGCAEGDCGACTVAVGRLVDGRVAYKSINSCIAFLPTLDGREVVTVEHLKSPSGQMNPVQEAMVACHGSQCGFCTPGFVMALSTLMNNKADAGTDDIQDAIAGNLCRCTGYRPILDAARQANKSETRALPAGPKALAALQRKAMFEYDGGDSGATAGKFFAPTTVEELIVVLSVYPDAVLLGGGTDVGLWVTKMHLSLATIIYTGNIGELRVVRAEGGGVEIGAAATWQEAFEALAAYDPSLRDMLARFASLHIRNAGTVGGNIGNGSPIGDGPPALIALGARLVLNSRNGPRKMPLEDFFLDYRKQDRHTGEFIEKIMVPAKPENVLFRVYKVSKRFDQDISAVCGAFALELRDGVVLDARICYGGMAATPKRAPKTEAALKGQPWSDAALARALPHLDEDYKPLTDMRASARYRSDVAKNLLKRFFIETTSPDVETRVYNYGA